MSTHQTAKTEFVVVDGVKYSYRRLGGTKGIPLLFLTHFRGTMDTWDPLLINNVSKIRPVILFDNAGVGHSGGEAADSLAKLTEEVIGFLKALSIEKVDILGFSIGGMIAQELALRAPELVRRLVLAGTNIGKGEGVKSPDADAMKMMKDLALAKLSEELAVRTWFSQSAASQEAGRAWWARMHERQVEGENRADFLEGEGMMTMFKASALWEGSYDRLGDIKIPVLVVAGQRDAMSPPINNLILSQRLPNAQLIVYSDAGHGFLFQHALLFTQHVKLFLEAE